MTQKQKMQLKESVKNAERETLQNKNYLQLFDKKERFRLVKKEGERLLELRKKELLERFQKVEDNQKEIKDKQLKEKLLKKEVLILKEKQKEENIKRYQRQLEYKKELYLQKLKAEQQTFNEVRKLKIDVIQERYYNHMIDQIKKHQLKESLEQMHIFKKYDTSKVVQITKDFEFLAKADNTGSDTDNLYTELDFN